MFRTQPMRTMQVSCMRVSNAIPNLTIEFDRKVPVMKPAKVGGSVEFHRGNHMVYDKNNMFVGNIRPRRYTYLQQQFCDFYDIPKIDGNTFVERLWYDELIDLMNRYQYTNKNVYNSMTLDTQLTRTLISAFELKTLFNFTPLNVPLFENQSPQYVSPKDVCFNACDEPSVVTSSFTKCAYSTPNIRKHIKRISDSISETKPSRHVITFPILDGMTLDDYMQHFPCSTLLCVIPKNSMYLQSSDHWFDMEHKNVINKYPIAVCMYYNEMSLLMNPVSSETIERIEHAVNKCIIPKQHTTGVIKISQPLWVNGVREASSANRKRRKVCNEQVVYTDASIRCIDNNMVSGIGVWYGPNHCKNIAQGIVCKWSNDVNFCELVAIYVALLNCEENSDVVLYTDSIISLKLIDDANNGVHIRNEKYERIVKMIIHLIKHRTRDTKLMKVKAHRGHIGNENADILARIGIYNKDAIVVENESQLTSKMRINPFTKTVTKIEHILSSWPLGK